jgi:hypothetical protein
VWEDVFKRNELDKRVNNVLLCVDGRANPLKHALDNFKLVADVAAAKATLKKAEEARADHPAYHTYQEADWIKLREDIKVVQKTIARNDRTYIASDAAELDPADGEVRARDGGHLRLRVRRAARVPFERGRGGLSDLRRL